MAQLKIHQLADLLFENKAAQDKFQEILKPLKEAEDDLRAAMLKQLQANRLDSFRSETSGFTYTRAYRASLEVTDEEKALKWAVKNNCAKVNTTEANKLLRGAGALPEGFQQSETCYLTINKPKSE